MKRSTLCIKVLIKHLFMLILLLNIPVKTLQNVARMIEQLSCNFDHQNLCSWKLSPESGGFFESKSFPLPHSHIELFLTTEL